MLKFRRPKIGLALGSGALNVKDADIVINPRIGRVGWSKFINSKDVILEGEKAMRSSISQLKKLMH